MWVCTLQLQIYRDHPGADAAKTHAAKNTGFQTEENPTQLLGIGGVLWRCLEPFALAELQWCLCPPLVAGQGASGSSEMGHVSWLPSHSLG